MAGIKVTVVGKAQLIEKLRNMGARAPFAMYEAVKDEMVKLADYVRATKLQGNPLNHRTGRLSRSVTGRADIDGTDTINGSIGVSLDEVPYAAVHEFGGTFNVPAYVREVDKVFGRSVKPFEQNVRAHTATYPQRAFLKPSMDERRDAILASLQKKLVKVCREA